MLDGDAAGFVEKLLAVGGPHDGLIDLPDQRIDPVQQMEFAFGFLLARHVPDDGQEQRFGLQCDLAQADLGEEIGAVRPLMLPFKELGFARQRALPQFIVFLGGTPSIGLLFRRKFKRRQTDEFPAGASINFQCAVVAVNEAAVAKQQDGIVRALEDGAIASLAFLCAFQRLRFGTEMSPQVGVEQRRRYRHKTQPLADIGERQSGRSSGARFEQPVRPNNPGTGNERIKKRNAACQSVLVRLHAC